MALVWRNGSSDYAPGTGDPYNIAEDVPVTAELPARFTLELTGPPPAIAMRAITSETADTDFPPGSSYARGALVVYDDLDRDGRLDLADAGATEEVDRLVGARGDLEVWYVAGGVPRTGHLDGGGQPDFLQLGYQVVIWDGERGRTVDSVDLPLTVADELRSIGCVDPMGPPSELRDHGTDAPAAYPTAPDTFECAPDGTRFELDPGGCREARWQTLCPTQTMCHIDIYQLADPANPPEGWPCEVTAGGDNS